MPEVEAGAVPNRGWYLLAVSWPLFSVCAIITALRFWVRIRIVRSCGWDDAFILLALICATINTVLITISVQHGTGCHTDTLSLKQQIASMKYQVLSQGFHVMSTNWGKVSVALFLIRIIGEVKNHKRGLIALIVIMSVINVGGVGTIYGQCSPPDMIWDHRVPGSCWPPGAHKKYAYFQGSASALTDLILAIYPLFTIKNLQMAAKVKVGLGVVLSLGIVAMIAAVIKTTYLPALTLYQDYTWDTVDLTIWVTIEQYIIILAACIPSLTPLFSIIVRHRSSKRSRSDPSPLNPNAHTSLPKYKSGRSGKRKLSRDRSQDVHLTSHDRADSHQQYVPFASVGREFVEYPLTWTQTHSKRDGYENESGSDSEAPITGGSGFGPEVPGQILRTTEFCIKEVSSSRFGGVG